MEKEKRRRLSNLFNPPEIYREASSESGSDDDEKTIPEENQIIDTNQENNSPTENLPITLRRSTRKKIRTTLPEEIRVSEKPVKLTAKSRDSEIKKYYLDKKVKRLNPSLETIYEEPQFINNEEVIMSTRKFKRSITFSLNNVKNPVKARKRKLKMKNLKTRKKGKKVSLEVLKSKLDELDE